MESIFCLLFSLSFSFLLLSAPALAASTAIGGAAPIPSGMIQRITKQQILATIPPGEPETAQPFITSPSGKYTAFLLRTSTAPLAGGFGNDFCYIQIQATAAGTGNWKSMWESSCEPVSSANACSLVFDDNGLEVFDGSQQVWDSSAGQNNNYPAMLEIVDGGDMRVIDKDGELVWRASDSPLVNQGCGLPGSPGLAPESPPFSSPIGGGQNPPFGGQNQLPSQSSAVNTQLNNGGLNQVAAPPPAVTDEEQQPPEVAAPPIDEEYGQQPPLPAVAATPSEAPLQQQEQPLLQGLGGGGGVGSQASAGMIGSQPLVDNSPYDSGSTRKEAWSGFGLASLLSFLLLF